MSDDITFSSVLATYETIEIILAYSMRVGPSTVNVPTAELPAIRYGAEISVQL